MRFGSDVCSNLATSETKEWLITNGIGGYGAGTISGLLTRRYHGLLIAALKPPLSRTLMLSKLNETATYNHLNYDLYCDRRSDQTVFPGGYDNLAQFFLVGTTPVWCYKLTDALLEKRIWMQQGENTTYIRYTYVSGSLPLTLSLNALVNYRDHHDDTHSNGWRMQIEPIDQGIKVKATANARELYLLASCSKDNTITWKPKHIWYHNLALAVEQYRGLAHCEDHLLAGTCEVTLNPGECLTIVASTKSDANLDGMFSWKERYKYEQQLLTKAWRNRTPSFESSQDTPQWIDQLVLAANQFIVDRPTKTFPKGKTIIAGYPWLNDWGRDTMISLPGLTLAIGRPSVARFILRTYAQYIDRGMLPNVFPDSAAKPDYNTADATLWYFEAIYSYYQNTQDRSLVKELFPFLVSIIDNYCQGTRYNIHQDSDGLLYSGAAGTQLTWMDAKIGNRVVTPRIGKPIEINALWYNALVIMRQLAKIAEKPGKRYFQLASIVEKGFQKFWNNQLGYCYDVIDTPEGKDDSLRPNQILAVSLPSFNQTASLLTMKQRKSVVDIVAHKLLTPYGLRSLDPNHVNYRGTYGGDRQQRDSSYHQGTVWAWLIGHFIQAYLKVYQQPEVAKQLLLPMAEHLETGCVGTISEIFDGDFSHTPRGCFAQAWSVAEVLRSWQLVQERLSQRSRK